MVIVDHGGASAVVRLGRTPFEIHASPMFCNETYERLMMEQACAMHGADRILLHSDVNENYNIWTVIIEVRTIHLFIYFLIILFITP